MHCLNNFNGLTNLKITSILMLALLQLIAPNVSNAKLGLYESWGVEKKNPASINLPNIKNLIFKKEVTVAVIDSGVDYNHPFIKSNLILTSKMKEEKDNNGHGTHIAGIIKSVFPKVKILPIKYYREGAKPYENIRKTIDAINYAVKMKVDIINYSSGGDGSNRKEKKALLQAQEKGILVVVAAGNNGENIDNKSHNYYPANYNLENILTVINHNQNIKLSDSSNYGKHTTDISAPGTRIKSSFPNKQAGYLSGTSQSTAFVTGVAALLKAYAPSLSFKDIKNIILKSSKKEKSLLGKCITGARLDASRAIELTKRYLLQKVAFMPKL